MEIHRVTGVQCVKESTFLMIEHDSNITYICLHYDSVIFEACKKLDRNGVRLPQYEIIREYAPSRTSSKMVNRCKDYLGL